MEDGARRKERRFRMSAHAPSSNSLPYKLLGKPVTTIDFVLPNRRYETIRAVNAKGRERWFASLTTVTPVTASTCRIDVIAAWDIAYWVPFVTPIARYFGAKFVAQDQQTMVEQARGLRSNPGLMLIDDADMPAKWYFALKQRRLTGEGEHPLKGPVGAALAKLSRPARTARGFAWRAHGQWVVRYPLPLVSLFACKRLKTGWLMAEIPFYLFVSGLFSVGYRGFCL